MSEAEKDPSLLSTLKIYRDSFELSQGSVDNQVRFLHWLILKGKLKKEDWEKSKNNRFRMNPPSHHEDMKGGVMAPHDSIEAKIQEIFANPAPESIDQLENDFMGKFLDRDLIFIREGRSRVRINEEPMGEKTPAPDSNWDPRASFYRRYFVLKDRQRLSGETRTFLEAIDPLKDQFKNKIEDVKEEWEFRHSGKNFYTNEITS